MTTRRTEYLVPSNEEEMQACLKDPEWRLFSGHLYKIIIKGDKGEDGLVLPFVPNRAQRRFIRRLWSRNIILKARQLGFTTLVCILWLDTALFNENMRCGIIAQDREAAEAIFCDKVRFAYEQLPEDLRAMMPLKKSTATQLVFAHNNSSIRVATSMRSGTIHRLHVSEFGKICAKYPDKAAEVVTGSIPAVPSTGILIIESTAEGRDGAFYGMSTTAMENDMTGKKLTPRDYRFHFFPWWREQGYQMDPSGVFVSDKRAKYFSMVESKTGTTLSDRQRAWYSATLDTDFSGAEERMWQEYPSYPEEAFQQSTEGCWLKEQMTAARKSGRICSLPLLTNKPCNTFWDIGNSDGTAIWVHQHVGMQDRFVRFYEAWGEPYEHAVKWLQGLGLIWGKHYLPHDADHVRQGATVNVSPRQMLEGLMPGGKFVTVDRTTDITVGINQLRDSFSTIYIDEDHCKDGIAHLDGYKKTWNRAAESWVDVPYKLDGHSEAADALRQFAQGYEGEAQSFMQKRRSANWRKT